MNLYREKNHVSFFVHTPFSHAILSVIEQHTDVSEEHCTTSSILVVSAYWGVFTEN